MSDDADKYLKELDRIAGKGKYCEFEFAEFLVGKF